LLALASGVACAQADVVDLNFLGTGAGGNVSLSLIGLGSMDVFSGQLRHHMANGTGALAGLNGDYVTFCPDLYQHVDSAVNSYTLTALANMPVVNPPVATMGAARAAVLNTLYANYGSTAETTGDNDFAEAFQLSVWEIVYDWAGGPLDVSGGNFTATAQGGGSLPSGVTAWIGAFSSTLGVLANGDYVLGLGNPDHQDQLVTPAPGALALIGAAGLCSRRRRA
jgi:hypothetical protein